MLTKSWKGLQRPTVKVYHILLITRPLSCNRSRDQEATTSTSNLHIHADCHHVLVISSATNTHFCLTWIARKCGRRKVVFTSSISTKSGPLIGRIKINSRNLFAKILQSLCYRQKHRLKIDIYVPRDHLQLKHSWVFRYK